MNELYCIHCERMAHVEEGIVFGHLIYVPVYDELGRVMGVDVDLCEFPSGFTYSALPEINPEWDKGLIEPGKDELTGEDFNSLELGQALAYFGQELVEV